MTIQQKQHLLGYLGYYTAAVDGIWGEKSRRAAEQFQKDHGLAMDVTFGPESQRQIRNIIGEEEVPKAETGENFWTEIRYFKRKEFCCTCGGRGCDGYPSEPRERLARNADQAREHFGRIAIVSSGVRCALRNSELSGSAGNSLHLSGRAMDFAIPGVSSAQLLAYIKTLPEVHEAYAIDGNYVHMGVQKY